LRAALLNHSAAVSTDTRGFIIDSAAILAGTHAFALARPSRKITVTWNVLCQRERASYRYQKAKVKSGGWGTGVR
jgi:hypothetical protein